MSQRINVTVGLALGDMRDTAPHSVSLADFHASGLTADDLAEAIVEAIETAARGVKRPVDEPPLSGPDYGRED